MKSKQNPMDVMTNPVGNKLSIQINEKVIVEKTLNARTVSYSILSPRVSWEIYLKPETAVKVVESLKVLLSNNDLEEMIERNGCQMINFKEYVASTNKLKKAPSR